MTEQKETSRFDEPARLLDNIKETINSASLCGTSDSR